MHGAARKGRVEDPGREHRSAGGHQHAGVDQEPGKGGGQLPGRVHPGDRHVCVGVDSHPEGDRSPHRVAVGRDSPPGHDVGTLIQGGGHGHGQGRVRHDRVSDCHRGPVGSEQLDAAQVEGHRLAQLQGDAGRTGLDSPPSGGSEEMSTAWAPAGVARAPTPASTTTSTAASAASRRRGSASAEVRGSRRASRDASRSGRRSGRRPGSRAAAARDGLTQRGRGGSAIPHDGPTGAARPGPGGPPSTTGADPPTHPRAGVRPAWERDPGPRRRRR